MSKIRSKISLKLLLAVILSFIASLTASSIMGRYTVGYYFLKKQEISPTYYNILLLLVFVSGILVFVLTLFLLINKKIKYLKYISKQVKEIADKEFGSTIKLQGNDEITELCQNINLMSKELKKKFDHEREIEKSKNDMIIGISHDLRTPLTAIKGYLQLVKDKQYQSTKELETYINVAFSRIVMLEDLIENLFEYTRLQGKEIKLEYQRLCLNDIVQQVFLDYGPLFDKENLNLQICIPKEKYFVEIDPEKYVRVLENLLGNALKYSLKPGNVSVSLNSENEGVRMTIKNKTQVIDAESLTHLFDRFYRIEKSRSKETGGVGLGLAIAKSIVELHGGRIWAESLNDIISFNVWFPLSSAK